MFKPLISEEWTSLTHMSLPRPRCTCKLQKYRLNGSAKHYCRYLDVHLWAHLGKTPKNLVYEKHGAAIPYSPVALSTTSEANCTYQPWIPQARLRFQFHDPFQVIQDLVSRSLGLEGQSWCIKTRCIWNKHSHISTPTWMMFTGNQICESGESLWDSQWMG